MRFVSNPGVIGGGGGAEGPFNQIAIFDTNGTFTWDPFYDLNPDFAPLVHVWGRAARLRKTPAEMHVAAAAAWPSSAFRLQIFLRAVAL